MRNLQAVIACLAGQAGARVVIEKQAFSSATTAFILKYGLNTEDNFLRYGIL